MENSSFVSAEVDDQINVANRQLVGLILRSGLAERFFVEKVSGSAVAGIITPPSDLFELVGVDVEVGGYFKEAKPLQWQDRNKFQNTTSPPYFGSYRYLLTGMGTTAPAIKLYPTSGNPQYEIYVIREPATLALDTDLVSYPNGWEEWIVQSVAIHLLDKEDSDSRMARAERAAVALEITNMGQSIDRAGVQSVRDVRGSDGESGGGLWGI